MRKLMRKIGIVLLVLAVALGIAGCNEGGKTYERAKDAYEKGHYEEAVSLYRLAISQGEKSGVVYADLALAYQGYGDTEKADEAMERALSEGKDREAVLKREGILKYLRSEYGEAGTLFERIVAEEDTLSGEKKPGQEALENVGFLAECRKENGEYREAIELFKFLITNGFHTLESKLKIGECLLAENEFYAAATYFDWAKEEPGMKPEHYLFIYRAAREAEDYRDSELYFQEGLSLCTGEDGTMTVGEYYAYAGKFLAAAEKLTTENTTGAILAKAAIAIRDGRYEEAESYYQLLVRRGEELPVVYNQYMILKAVQGEYDAAKQLLSEIRSYRDRSIEEDVDWNEIILYEMQQEYRKAYDLLLEFRKTYGQSEETEREERFLSRVLTP